MVGERESGFMISPGPDQRLLRSPLLWNRLYSLGLAPHGESVIRSADKTVVQKAHGAGVTSGTRPPSIVTELKRTS